MSTAETIVRTRSDSETERKQEILEQLETKTSEEIEQLAERHITAAKHFTWQTADELLEKELPPLKFIIDGLLPEGLSVIYGRPKSGKTSLLMSLAAAVAGELNFTNSYSLQKRKVLYLALEDGERRIQRKIKRLGLGSLPNLIIVTKKDFPYRGTEAILKLDDWLEDEKAGKGTEWIIVDTFSALRELEGPRNTTQRDEYIESQKYRDLSEKRRRGESF